MAVSLSLWFWIWPNPSLAATTTYTFPVSADATINESQPDDNKGQSASLWVSKTPNRHVLLRFSVSGIGSDRVVSATLRLSTVDSSVQGGDVHGMANSWSEGSVTWQKAPPAQARIGSLGNVASGTWSEVDVTPLISGNGTYNVRLVPISTDAASYSSKEAAGGRGPQLVVTVSTTTPPPSPPRPPAPPASLLPTPPTPPPQPPAPPASLAAFPGAEGFGSTTPGGRGGRVIAVTNLDDSGPGSFRAALETSGPRIVVFRVGGTIKLLSALHLSEPYITIAGQTAPGGGITIRKDPVLPDAGPTLYIRTHDVVIRYLRFRPGSDGTAATRAVDAVTTINAARVILDHVSMSWGIDENFNVWDNTQDVTVQWSIISEGLDQSTHQENPHSCGALIGGANSDRVSFHHNLLAHNRLRNPRHAMAGVGDYVNNVIYNFGTQAGLLNDWQGRVSVNYVGNYVQLGPDSSLTQYELKVDPSTGPGFSIYAMGNLGPHRPDDTFPQDAVVAPDARTSVVWLRHAAPAVTTTAAGVAFTDVLVKAGATVPVRDAVDQRIISEVQSGRGRIINHPNDVGGYPDLPSGTPPLDSDGDGIPDDWEIAHGLDPLIDDSAGDRDGDGYTNIEEYINSLAR